MPRVLVIDDQAHVRTAIKAALDYRGFDVVVAGDGAAGLATFESGPFDLAIIDIYMPKMDGVQVIKQLRVKAPNLPIIAISGVELGLSERTPLDFLPNAGLGDVLRLKKPFRASDLMAILDGLPQFARTQQSESA